MDRLVRELAPKLVAVNGVGPDVAGQLLVSAGDNPDRPRSEAAFAMLRGVAPLPAGRTATGSTAAGTARPTPRSTA